jgi:hypothetical protein
MSPDEAASRHSAEWKAFLSSTAGQTLLWWLEQQSSAKSCINIADINERLGGAVVHFNTIIGEQRMLKLIAGLLDPTHEPFNPPDAFSEPEI